MKIATISDIHGMWLPLKLAPHVIPNFDSNLLTEFLIPVRRIGPDEDPESVDRIPSSHITLYQSKTLPLRLSTNLNYPTADILVFAGDVLNNYGKGNILVDASTQLEELELLDALAGHLLKTGIYKHIILVAGNHDWCFAKYGHEARKRLKHIIYLEDSGTSIDGVNFYGSPHQPYYGGWAFNFPGNDSGYKRSAQLAWGAIPDDTHVLITHGPPSTILDTTKEGIEIGCVYLEDRVNRLPALKLHVFGHVHHSFGKTTRELYTGNTAMFVNTAICDNKYEPTRALPLINI